MLRITLLSGQELTSIAVEDALDVKALKQRLNKSHGLPPRFRQRLLQEGQTLDDAFQLDSPMDLQVVLTTFAKPSHCQVEQLIIAARDGFVSEVEALLQFPVDPDVVKGQADWLDDPDPEDDCTALMLASSYNHPEIVKLLLEASAQVNFADECGWTALMNATLNGHAQVVQLLLEARAQTHPLNAWGQTAIDVAMERGRVMRMQPAGEDQNEVCRLLMQAEGLALAESQVLKEEA
eukprot:s742_g13.t1